MPQDVSLDASVPARPLGGSALVGFGVALAGICLLAAGVVAFQQRVDDLFPREAAALACQHEESAAYRRCVKSQLAQNPVRRLLVAASAGALLALVGFVRNVDRATSRDRPTSWRSKLRPS